MSAEIRLATYGTLAPGRENNHQLSDLAGSWTNGVVWGRLIEEGWGAAAGFPGIVLEIDGDPVDVHIFESNDLPAHWHRLDLFEGKEYRRVPTIAKTRNGDIEVSIYEVIKPL